MARHERHKGLTEAARRFRQSPTHSEELLWQEIRGRKLGAKFRRQHPIGSLIADFCCPELRLIVEVDGPIHRYQQERDAARQSFFDDRGYRLLRLDAEEVEQDLPVALDRIRDAIHQQTDRLYSPSPTGERGLGGEGRSRNVQSRGTGPSSNWATHRPRASRST